MSSILLAEDSFTHAALIRSILESDGHQVECVENGRLALATLGHRVPDLVVTDLRMPELNGLELIQAMTADFPQLPTVVVTARGSESLAVDALAQGAVNFVPKNSLNKLLVRVVGQTIRQSQHDATYFDFAGQLHRPEFILTIDLDLSAIEPAVLYVVQTLAASGNLDPIGRMRVGTAVGCALFNAVCFGSLEIRDDEPIFAHLLDDENLGLEEIKKRAAMPMYDDRKVTLKASIDHDDTRISVMHMGNGTMARMTPSPGTPESFELEQCRGTMLMTSFMDDVIFRAGGTEVVMVKQHHTTH